jgi:dihydrofolate reductase
MRTLTYLVATTLDGFIAAPGGGDPTGSVFDVTPDYLEHLVTHYPETLPDGARTALGIASPATRFDTVLEGRRSYQVGLDAGVTNAYPHLRHVVFSRSLGQSPDPTVEVTAADPVETVRQLKGAGGGGIWLVGGAQLAGALYDEIDELVLKVNPVTLGSGIPLFGASRSSTVRSFELAGSQALPGGVAVLTYRRPVA